MAEGLLAPVAPQADDDAPVGQGVGGKGLSALDKIRARYEAFHALPTHIDLEVPGQPLLGVRYSVRERDEDAHEPGTAERLRKNAGGPDGDMLMLVEHCDFLLVRDDPSAPWEPLTDQGMSLGFEEAAASLLGFELSADADSVEVARAVFSTARVPESAAGYHVARFLRFVGEPPSLDDEAALGESLPVPT
jgi:hypothetical protein